MRTNTPDTAHAAIAMWSAQNRYILSLTKITPEGLEVFERILVPLDGSEHSMHALRNAIQIAKKCDGKIMLVHVYSVLRVGVVPMAMAEPVVLPPDLISKLTEAVREAGVTILKEAEKKVKAEGIQSKTILREGHVVEEILRVAKEEDIELIVIGARGLSTIKEIFLGSVSHGVSLHAPCPVLLMR